MQHRTAEAILERSLLGSAALPTLLPLMLTGSAAGSQTGFPGEPRNPGHALTGDRAVSEMCNVPPGLHQHLCRRGEQGVSLAEDAVREQRAVTS